MALITFENLPSTNTPINAANLNNNFNECINHTGSIIYSGDISATGNYNFSSSGANYRFLIIELTTSSASARSYILIPGPKIFTDNSMYISFNISDSTVVWARIIAYGTYISVIDLSSNAHIRSIRGIL